jgi:hypothetical protein
MYKLLVTLLLVLIVAGCGTAAPLTPQPTNTPPPTSTNEPTVTNTSTPLPTATATSEPTATATAEPTAEPTLEATPDIHLTRAARMPSAIPQDTVTFSSNAFAENTGVLVNFQHPRAWQPSYFSDSGFSGWLISDADPNEAFWSALSTGEESLLMIMPVYDLEYLREFPAESESVLIEANGKTIQYVLADDEISGYIIQDDIAFGFFGRVPATHTSEYQADLENMLTSFTWEDLGDTDLTDVWLLGTRIEGTITAGNTVDGYVPLASISEWAFTGTKDDVVNLTINTYEPNVSLVVDVMDESGESRLSKGAEAFTSSISVDELVLPTDGTYRIQVTASTGFGKLGPWNPPAEAKIYGWYKLTME